MQTVKIAILFLIIGVIFGYYIIDLIILKYEIKKYGKGKHFCNKCKAGFLKETQEIEYIFCPYCGAKLTYHKDDIRYREDSE